MKANALSVRKMATAFVALNAVDAALTVYAIGNGANELNPVMANLLDTPALFWLVKIGGSTVVALALLWLDSIITNRYLASIFVPRVLMIMVVIMLGICLWNVTTILIAGN